MKRLTGVLFLMFSLSGTAQLFDNEDHIALVKTGVGYVYNIQPDSAEIYIDSLERVMSGHPVVSLMKALNVLWPAMPNVTEGNTFDIFTGHLYETIKRANRLDGGRQEDPEAIFFELTARGLLAEYYSDGGHNMKAISEAGQAYVLLREAFDLSTTNPEFYLPMGVYNYFREKYPEKHPSYKPFMWIFRSGDAELGISQMQQACRQAVLTKVEAYIYLSYIYLRYEEIPQLAQSYLLELSKMYPNNYYVTSKYLESLSGGDDFQKAPVGMIKGLLNIDKPYYQLAGNSFMGLYMETIKKDRDKAVAYYKKSFALEDQTRQEPDFYLSLSNLGMSRIYAERGNKEKAVYYARRAMDRAETEEVRQAAKTILYRME